MTEDMSRAKARVLVVYLEAFESTLGSGIYNMPRYRAEAVGVEQRIIGEDWIDAASRLPAEPKVEDAVQLVTDCNQLPKEAEGGRVKQPTTYDQWRRSSGVRNLFAGYSPSTTGLMEAAAQSAWKYARGEK